MLRLGDAMSILARSTYSSVGEFAGAHPSEQVQAFFGWAIAVGAFLPRFGEGAAKLPDLVGGEAVHVGVAVADELLGVVVELLEIVGGVEEIVAPIKTQPLHVGEDRFDVLDVLAGGVGVVKPHVAAGAPVLLADAEVEADRLGMADVEVAVGLGREPGHHAAVVGAGGLVLVDDGADEIGGGFGGSRGRVSAHVRIAQFPRYTAKARRAF